jgi:hypothetical protein
MVELSKFTDGGNADEVEADVERGTLEEIDDGGSG